MTTDTIKWASNIQRDGWCYGPYPQLLSGGFGSGKSWLGCMKALWLSDTFERNRGAIIRQVGKQLRATTMATFRKLCPPSAYSQGSWNQSSGNLVLNNKSEILWIHLDDPESIQLIKGLEINWFFWDQAEENPEGAEAIFDMLVSRLGRWDQAVVPRWMIDYEESRGRRWRWYHPVSGRPTPPQYPILACNPDSELHWLFRRFHTDSPEHRDKFSKKGYKLFHMPSTENQFLTEQNKQNLLDQDETFVRRYVLGLWGFPEGAIHDVTVKSKIEFHEAIDAARFLDQLRNTCHLYRFMDHGDSAPTVCGWCAVDREGNIFWYREYYQPNKLISYHRESITALSEYETYESSVADPSIFNQTMQKLVAGKPQRWSVADEYKDLTEVTGIKAPAIHWLPADNNEMGTRNRINELLRVDPARVHPVTKQLGAPRMFFVMRTDAYPQGCFFLPKETANQRRVQVGTLDGRPIFSDERRNDIPDHGYDVTRYGTAKLKSAAVIVPQRPGHMTFTDAGKLADEARFNRRIRP